MRLIKNVFAGLFVLSIPVLVEYPVMHAPAAGRETALPREILMARLADAARAAQADSGASLGRAPALVGLSIALVLLLWLAFRRRPVAKPPRPARARRALVALDLIRSGAASDDVMVRAHVSRDAIELLRRTTIGHSLN